MTPQTIIGLALFAGLIAWVWSVLASDAQQPPRYPAKETDL